MKKTFICILSALLALMLCACAGAGDRQSEAPSGTPPETPDAQTDPAGGAPAQATDDPPSAPSTDDPAQTTTEPTNDRPGYGVVLPTAEECSVMETVNYITKQTYRYGYKRPSLDHETWKIGRCAQPLNFPELLSGDALWTVTLDELPSGGNLQLYEVSDGVIVQYKSAGSTKEKKTLRYIKFDENGNRLWTVVRMTDDYEVGKGVFENGDGTLTIPIRISETAGTPNYTKLAFCVYSADGELLSEKTVESVENLLFMCRWEEKLVYYSYKEKEESILIVHSDGDIAANFPLGIHRENTTLPPLDVKLNCQDGRILLTLHRIDSLSIDLWGIAPREVVLNAPDVQSSKRTDFSDSALEINSVEVWLVDPEKQTAEQIFTAPGAVSGYLLPGDDGTIRLDAVYLVSLIRTYASSWRLSGRGAVVSYTFDRDGTLLTAECTDKAVLYSV